MTVTPLVNSITEFVGDYGTSAQDNYSLLFTHYSVFIIHYSLLIIYYQFLITHYSLIITIYTLLILDFRSVNFVVIIVVVIRNNLNVVKMSVIR